MHPGAGGSRAEAQDGRVSSTDKDLTAQHVATLGDIHQGCAGMMILGRPKDLVELPGPQAASCLPTFAQPLLLLQQL